MIGIPIGEPVPCTVCVEKYLRGQYREHAMFSTAHSKALAERRALSHHAVKNVYETRIEYRCGVCSRPVVRYSAPRAHWEHR